MRNALRCCWALAMLSLASVVIAPLVQAQESGQYVREVVNDRYGALFRHWLDQDVIWIITPEERDAYLRLSNDDERLQFIRQFWERRNPAPGDPQNKFREEHYRRIAYANQHFQVRDDPGWRTDRGRAYIVFGPPDAISPGDVDTLGRPTVIWHYGAGKTPGGKDRDLTFVDVCWCEDYRLQSPFPK